MWQIYEHRRLERVASSVPEEVLKRYEKWKDIVGLSGPEGLRRIKGFHDEAWVGNGRAIARRDWGLSTESSTG